jgi:hypothetical protein
MAKWRLLSAGYPNRWGNPREKAYPKFPYVSRPNHHHGAADTQQQQPPHHVRFAHTPTMVGEAAAGLCVLVSFGQFSDHPRLGSNDDVSLSSSNGTTSVLVPRRCQSSSGRFSWSGDCGRVWHLTKTPVVNVVTSGDQVIDGGGGRVLRQRVRSALHRDDDDDAARIMYHGLID